MGFSQPFGSAPGLRWPGPGSLGEGFQRAGEIGVQVALLTGPSGKIDGAIRNVLEGQQFVKARAVIGIGPEPNHRRFPPWGRGRQRPDDCHKRVTPHDARQQACFVFMGFESPISDNFAVKARYHRYCCSNGQYDS